MQEEQNTDSIWLYREGIFMKAYERSAFFAHTLYMIIEQERMAGCSARISGEI